MSLLIIKLFLKRAWYYIKTYWWVGCLIAVGFLLHKFFLMDRSEWAVLYEEKLVETKKEREIIETSYKKEIEGIKKTQEEYSLTIKALQEDRIDIGKKIKEEEKKRIKEIMTMPTEERVAALAEEFGLEIVEVDE